MTIWRQNTYEFSYILSSEDLCYFIWNRELARILEAKQVWRLSRGQWGALQPPARLPMVNGQCLTHPTYLVDSTLSHGDRGRIFRVLSLRGNHLQLTLKTCRKVIFGSGVEPAPVWHKSNLEYSFSCRLSSVVPYDSYLELNRYLVFVSCRRSSFICRPVIILKMFVFLINYSVWLNCASSECVF